MAESNKVMSTVLKVILGLAFLALGVFATMRWWGNLFYVVKACIGPFLLLAGVITLAIAKE
jgi:hypothetical protein